MRYLLIQLMLQVLLRPEEFSEAASELVIFCTKAFRSYDVLVSSVEGEADGDDTPELMNVLVGTMFFYCHSHQLQCRLLLSRFSNAFAMMTWMTGYFGCYGL